MRGYVTDLGWEYVHANRVFWVARTGLTEFTGIPTYCFNKVKHHFSDALGALYIRDHLLVNEKKEVSSRTLFNQKGQQIICSLTFWGLSLFRVMVYCHSFFNRSAKWGNAFFINICTQHCSPDGRLLMFSNYASVRVIIKTQKYKIDEM